MDDYLKVLLSVRSRLEQAGIPHMLSGSTAMNFYARPRMTRDVDIVVELEVPKVPVLLSLFQADFSIDEEEIREALSHQSLFNLIHFETVVKVACVIRKRSAYRQEEFRRRRTIDLQGQRIWIVSPEDLVLSKLYWARDSLSEMQLGDVRNILEATSSMDWTYLRHWARDLGIESLLEKVKP
ncbi:nucleotidyltransferase family protein [Myxococcus sp. K38C18041901]|uniref:nucleotidyltransferase family protein n=1 Tax=Myxococcus guangdongensis TaxID=2906760 RepID=UPI0020A7730B|nr:nucleotidyltransferase family protein [Myxococcus guangdongensis]MCP3062760.1 nucleotidyltransferase family protein [Myxococcus guangdongensis]